MTVFTRVVALLVLGGLGLPAMAVPSMQSAAGSASVPQLLARGGGGRMGGGAGAGGGRMGGGSGRAGGAARPSTGFAAAGSGLNRGGSRPAGGWSTKVPADRAMPSLNRPAMGSGQGAGSRLNDRIGDRPANGLNRDLNRNVNRDLNRNVNRDVNRNIARNWGRDVNLNNVNLYPGWARPGWGAARPWNYGWYGGWATPAWGWWGARAAVWGITSLATASVINSAVNSAVQNQVSYITVPDSDVQLLYGTVQPNGSNGVSFLVTVNGNSYRLTADCQSGSLNGNVPASAAEAQLVNAACQVAYGAA
jgi:hypothetical protein